MAETDLARPAFRYSSAGRRPERLNQSRNVNAPLQLARGWAAGLLGLPGDIEGLVRLLPGLDETPRLPTSDFYREYLPGYDPRPAARAMSGLGALTGGAGATSVVRGGLGAVKRATDLNAIRDYVRSAQGVGGMPGAAVVKPRGGNWISGAGSPEEAVRGLKATAVGMDPAERIPLLDNLIREQEAAGAVTPEFLDRMRVERGRLTGDAELNRWIDQKLARYMRNEMGTPEDPLRELAERDILHYAPGEPSDTQKTRAALVRSREGYPAGGLGESDLARRWEVISDYPITPERAGDLMRLGEGSPTIRGNPWLAKVPPETSIYSIDASARYGDVPLGFNHLVDELRNAVREGSDLPRELQLRPEQLSKVSMPQAVELVDRINKWRAAQKAEADLARANNAAAHTFKDYPEAGFRWVELKAPEALPEGWSEVAESGGTRFTSPSGKMFSKEQMQRMPLEDALKYEGETMGHCVGGYCPDVMEGRSRIFSLRDAKGQPHVTIEVKPGVKAPPGAVPFDQLPDSVKANLIERGLTPSRFEEGTLFDASGKRYRTSADQIVQIKGKANKAPKEEYLPYVQDFVRSGRWGRVGDMKNTGLVDISTYPDAPEYLRRGPRFISQQEYDDAVRRAIEEQKRAGNEPGYARGGMVSAAGGPAQYDPARISALVEELLMEA